MTLVGAAAIVVVTTPPVPVKAVPVMVAFTAVLSPAWLLGCHDDVTTPPDVVVLELGEKVVVNPVAGYEPLAAEKVTGTPTCVGAVRVAVTVWAAPPAVYEAMFPVTATVGATSPV